MYIAIYTTAYQNQSDNQPSRSKPTYRYFCPLRTYPQSQVQIKLNWISLSIRKQPIQPKRLPINPILLTFYPLTPHSQKTEKKNKKKNMVLVFKYPCADCGKMLRENKLGWCDHEDSEYYCPACWDDDTTTLPPPPADMVAEAEKENQKYIHELFAKVLTIPEAQPIRRAIDKVVHAHPCAKMMDDLIAEYWKPSRFMKSDKMGPITQRIRKHACCMDKRTSPYDIRMLLDCDVWDIKILFGRDYYLYDRDEIFAFKGLNAYSHPELTGSLKSSKLLYRICADATKTLKGKEKHDRAKGLGQLLNKFQNKEGITFDLVVKTFKANKFNRIRTANDLWEQVAQTSLYTPFITFFEHRPANF